MYQCRNRLTLLSTSDRIVTVFYRPTNRGRIVHNKVVRHTDNKFGICTADIDNIHKLDLGHGKLNASFPAH